VRCAIAHPVGKPTEVPSGSPKSSTSHRAVAYSAVATAGPRSYTPQFWSQALTSQSAAMDTGSVPPTTNPK
jgi:hypothetical protein